MLCMPLKFMNWVLQETVDQRRIQREISILRRLTHGSIIQLLEIVETEHYIFLVSNMHVHPTVTVANSIRGVIACTAVTVQMFLAGNAHVHNGAHHCTRIQASRWSGSHWIAVC